MVAPGASTVEVMGPISVAGAFKKLLLMIVWW
jgi:hypothetical protein